MGPAYADDGRLSRDAHEAATRSTSPQEAGEGISRLLAPSSRTTRSA
ncbi:hypothetical protein [Streptomyces sp. NPDC004266]